MSRQLLKCLGLGVVLAGMGAAAANVRQPQNDSDLNAELQALRQRVDALEQRLRQLESGRGVIVPPNGLYGVPGPEAFRPGLAVPPSDFPPGTERRDFNGMSYYIMPVDG